MLEISLFYTCVLETTIIWCMVSDREWDRQNFLFWAIFVLLPPNDLEYKNFWKMKKMPGDITLLQMCTRNEDHMIYGSWNIRYNRQNVLSFWAIFWPFTPWQPEKSKFWKIERNTRRYHHFTQVSLHKKWSFP